MSDKQGEPIEEEPQEERGPEASRDTGADEPGAGPSGRKAGRATEQEDTSLDPSVPQDPDAPDLQPNG